jgi:hypothetical protein
LPPLIVFMIDESTSANQPNIYLFMFLGVGTLIVFFVNC